MALHYCQLKCYWRTPCIDNQITIFRVFVLEDLQVPKSVATRAEHWCNLTINNTSWNWRNLQIFGKKGMIYYESSRWFLSQKILSNMIDCDFIFLRPIPDREFVETYVKAFYLTENEMERWIREHKVSEISH